MYCVFKDKIILKAGEGGDLVLTKPGYVCPKVKGMGLFLLQWSEMMHE